MDQSTLFEYRVLIASLYLRGLSRSGNPNRKSWQQIESLLRKEALSTPLSSQHFLTQLLLKNGFWLEARILESQSLLDQAEELVMKGKVLTSMCPAYPPLWRSRLRADAPLALWSLPEAHHLLQFPTHTIVGSRDIPVILQEFAQEAGQAAIKSNHAVLSGGAPGADRKAAIDGMTIEIWPAGLEAMPSSWGSGTRALLSMAAPNEPFSAPLAMERNHLLYAASKSTLVVHARYLKGGSWHGAVNALRRKLCPVFIPDVALWDMSVPDKKGPQALVAIGARSISLPSEGLNPACSFFEHPQLTLAGFASS